MGAGAEGFQIARKWAETLGAPVNATTTPTAMAGMQLGQLVYDKLGSLGAQVSNTDRDWLISVQGSIGSDPEALRRMILIDTKYRLQALTKTNNEIEEVSKRHEVKLPKHNVVFRLSDRNAKDFDALFNEEQTGTPAPLPAKPVLPAPAGRLKRAGR